MRATRSIIERWHCRLAALLASLAVAGCGGGGNSDSPGSALPPGDAATIAAGGGVVAHADGARLTVPADALRAASTLRIAKNSTDAPLLPDGALASDVYAITPHGTQFAQPATVRLPYDARQLPQGSHPVIAKAETPDGPWRLLDTVIGEDGTVSAQVSSLSWFVVMPGPMTVIGAVDLTPRLTYRLSSSDGVGDWVVPAGVDVTATKTLLRPASQYYELTLINAPACAGGWSVSVETSRQYRNSAHPEGSMVTDRIASEGGGYTTVSSHAASDGVFRIEIPWSRLEQVNNMTEFESFATNPSQRVVGDIFFHAFVDHPYCASSRTFYPAAAPAVRRLEISARTGARKITVSRHPASTTVGAGQPVVFSADIFNSGPAPTDNRLRVDWLRAEPGSALFVPLGSTFSVDTTGSVHSLRLAAATAADNGARYRAVACVIDSTSAASDCVETEAATLTVTQAVVVPAFTQMPASLLVRSGQTASFSAAATGTPAPTLQWQTRAPNSAGAWADVAGATAGTYTTAVLVPADNGRQLRVVATNAVGTAESTPVTVSVSDLDVAPIITTQPATIAVAAGGDAVFAVAARGTEALSYQWRFNGSRIAGANAAVLRLAAVSGAQAGLYSVVVSNAAGSATSADATLDVTAGGAVPVAPSIVTAPANVSVHEGDSATFAVGVGGTGPFSYQWLKEGQPIAGATAAYYSLGTATSGDAGNYAVRIGNAAGTVTSPGAVLTVTAQTGATPVSISTQPSPQVQMPGGSATFAVAASGSGPITYQWLKNGAPIAGATGAVLVLSGVTGSDAASYAVTVGNGLGSVTSSGAALTVVGAPAITTQPAARNVVAGSTATFSVTATGSALGYQWTRDGVAIPGATAASYTTPALAVADSGSDYAVVVYNGAGVVLSNPALLLVSAAPTATPAQARGKLAAAYLHTCAITAANAVACWGHNSSGQIGTGNVQARSTPFVWSLPEAAVSVSTGANGSCAVSASGNVWCSGSPLNTLVPTQLAGWTGVRQVAVGQMHTCLLAGDATVWCWGANGAGQLGNGGTSPSATPVQVQAEGGAPLAGVQLLQAGLTHTCAALDDYSTRCWGTNSSAQSGAAAGVATPQATSVAGAVYVDQLALGGRFSCAYIGEGGQVRCWGLALDGSGGTNPVATSAFDLNPAAVGAGEAMACAITNAGAVYCWGTGMMGNGDVNQNQWTPTAVSGLGGALAMAGGQGHSCVLRNGGSLQCWGSNSDYQLGLGDSVPRTTPAEVSVAGGFWRP